jgi:hypothetical protein
MTKLIKLVKSKAKGKKYTAVFELTNGKIKTSHFGATGYSDFILSNGDVKKRKAYIARHKHEDWNDPTKPSTLSRYILWEDKSFQNALKKFKIKFKV